MPDIAASVKEKLEEKEISLGGCSGDRYGSTGTDQSGWYGFKCVNLGWGIFNVEQKMEQLIGLKAKAGNDANVAALGEMWQGGGKGYDSIVMVTLGTGVGGGVIINGQILRNSWSSRRNRTHANVR